MSFLSSSSTFSLPSSLFTAAAVTTVAFTVWHANATWKRRRCSLLLPVDSQNVILVTGADTGIGRATALALAHQGFTVFAGVLQAEHGKQLLATAQRYQNNVARIHPILLDVTNEAHIQAAVATIQKAVGDRGLYGLFNNAGVSPFSRHGNSVENYPMEMYQHLFDVNVFGILRVTKAFLPLLRQYHPYNGSTSSRIVNMSSIAGFLAPPFVSGYAASKHAVEAISDSLRRELDPLGVHVSIVQASAVKSSIYQAFENLKHIKKEESSPNNNNNNDNVYADREDLQAQKSAKRIAIHAHPTRVVSQAVVHAMRARQPHIRYQVGYRVEMYKFLARLPATWLDALLRRNGQNSASGGLATEQDWDLIWKFIKEDAELFEPVKL